MSKKEPAQGQETKALPRRALWGRSLQKVTGSAMASASEGLDPEAFSHIPQEELEKLKAILKKGDLMVAEANTRGALKKKKKHLMHRYG
ncbi:hypothetical protein Y1Q_0013887 [Alligator mississippiensis]|uniref:Uncharacterized protein n=1 Tax=Alligator mississippiensis TaxID=8496 RepID=A0A151P565_ALLMI|nr:hypothetical protein Y1Q_0013887 [Alligator mississippiensis]